MKNKTGIFSLRNDRGRIQKTWYVVGAAVLWLTWISGVFGNNGILQASRLSDARHELTMRVKAMEAEKQRLEASLAGLHKDPVAQEKAIRETLGFVRENELVFEFR